MTEYQAHMKNNPNMRMALGRARAFARSGNTFWAQLWLDRAQSFAYVSPRQVKNLQKLLDKAKEKSCVSH